MIEEPSARRAATADPVSCPYLGLADDQASHFAFATSAHRCHSAVGSGLIAISHQAALCLTADHPSCTRYKVPAATGATPAAATPAAPASAIATADTGGRVRWRGASYPLRGRVNRAAAILVGGLTLAIVGIVALGFRAPTPAAPSAVAASIASTGDASPPSSPTTTPTGPAANVDPSPSPAPTPPPSGAPTSTVSASPSAKASPQPTIYTVVRGDTLTSIARAYGISLDALKQANPSIENPSLIVVGQQIVIPIR